MPRPRPILFEVRKPTNGKWRSVGLSTVFVSNSGSIPKGTPNKPQKTGTTNSLLTAPRWPLSPLNLVVGVVPDFQLKVVGNSALDLQKFDNGWKIVASHTSTGGV
jgi:hypothetical protein